MKSESGGPCILKVNRYCLISLHKSFLVIYTHLHGIWECLFPSILPHGVLSAFFHFSFLPMVAQTVKCLPAVRETRVRSLSWEYPLEKEMATHSSTLAWKIPWTKEPGRLESMGSQRVGHDWATSLFQSQCSKMRCQLQEKYYSKYKHMEAKQHVSK